MLCSNARFTSHRKLDLDEIMLKIVSEKGRFDFISIVLNDTYETIKLELKELDAKVKCPTHVYMMTHAKNIDNMVPPDTHSLLKHVKFKRTIMNRSNDWIKLVQPTKLEETFAREEMIKDEQSMINLNNGGYQACGESTPNVDKKWSKQFDQMKIVEEIIEEDEEMEEEGEEQKKKKEMIAAKVGELKTRKSSLIEGKTKLENERLRSKRELEELEEKRQAIVDRVDEYKNKLKIMSNEMITFESRVNASIAYLRVKSKKRRKLDESLRALRDFLRTVELKEYDGIPDRIVTELEQSIES